MLDSVTANEVAKKQVKRIKDIWNTYLNSLDKRSVLAHMIWQREKQCREFFGSYTTLNIEEILSRTLLIKLIIKNEDFSKNGEKIEDEWLTYQYCAFHPRMQCTVVVVFARIIKGMLPVCTCLNKS